MEEFESTEEVQRHSLRWNSERLDEILDSMHAHRLAGRTGLEDLDELLDGGLYPEVYVLGAEPGTGKTTLALQIADRLAQFGDRKVLFFSQEMSSGQIVAKSISNMSSKVCANVIYARSIQNPKRLDSDLLADCTKAIECYRQEVAPNIATIDGHITVSEIQQYIEDAITDGFAPIVFVDYLQILRSNPESFTRTDYQLHSENMRSLIELSITYNTPVFVISSKNRANRNSKTLDSFTGSSDIEYGASVAMFLDVDGDTDEEKEANRNKDTRSITLSVVKNRNGKTGKVHLYFKPAENKFITAVKE